ncbi:sensor histidine kinase [Catenulispora subtropica]|uniref:histidine kinase n=1 Tax=Catenulispora subtropica TaxID=450798 RepID=A0ABN2SMB1_9ACTN
MTVSVGAREAGRGMRLFAGALDGLLVPDDLPDGFVAADDGGVVRVFNRAASALTGIAADDALGRDFTEVLPLRTSDGRDWWRLTDPYGGLSIRTGHPEVPLWLMPGDGAGADGDADADIGADAGPDTRIPLLSDAAAIDPETGTELLVTARYLRRDGRSTPVTGLVLALRGTELRRRRDRRQADLIATVAHELRSPLTSVKGFTATLLARWDRFTDDQKRMMLQTVDADADRVVRLIAELLDVARLDSGRMELRRVPVDLHELITDQVRACVAQGVPEETFRIQVPRGLPAVSADPDKLRQVLANLLENAVRHGGGTVTIEARAEDDRSHPDSLHTEGVSSVAVAVSDEGPGIPEDQLTRVFTRFFRGGRRGGTGLGLSIVKGLVEAHGGVVSAGNAATGGARFRFTLPVA